MLDLLSSIVLIRLYHPHFITFLQKKQYLLLFLQWTLIKKNCIIKVSSIKKAGGFSMKITKLELIKVKPRWMFLKMYTDTDIIGLGEPILEGHANAVEAVVKEFEEYLIGKDPMQIEHHVQALYRGGFYRGGPLMLSAISGIEQAMWDIKGKYYNCPVYEMLGGKCRDKIRMSRR